MRATAARLLEHGSPLQVGPLELPDPTKGECWVEMAFAGVNPVDRYQALGTVAPEAPLPRTLGSEGAGVVREGESLRRVFCNRSAIARQGDGLWASGLVAKADKLIEVPEEVSLEEAAAMGVAGVTAWRCVTELGEVEADDRVLVLGASGGVGSIIVSLAHRIGAQVLAQVGSAEKATFASARGADKVVVADADSLGAGLGGFTPTVVFDPLGDGFTGVAIEALEARGRLVIFGTSAEGSGTMPLRSLYRKALKVIGYAGLIESEGRLAKATEDAFEALASKKMEIAIDRVRPLGEVNEALEDIAERRVLGKQLLRLS